MEHKNECEETLRFLSSFPLNAEFLGPQRGGKRGRRPLGRTSGIENGEGAHVDLLPVFKRARVLTITTFGVLTPTWGGSLTPTLGGP